MPATNPLIVGLDGKSADAHRLAVKLNDRVQPFNKSSYEEGKAFAYDQAATFAQRELERLLREFKSGALTEASFQVGLI